MATPPPFLPPAGGVPAKPGGGEKWGRKQPVRAYSGRVEDLVVGGHTIPGDELEEFFETSGGPGGQHANRSATAVRLRLDVSASSLPDDVRTKIAQRLGSTVEVTVADSRSQFRNRALARRRLRERIEKALVDPPERRPTRPTRSSKQQRLEDKQARSEIKRLRRPPEADT